MKKVISLILFVTMLMCLSGCTKYENEMFISNKADFTAMVEFARSYYEEHKSENKDHITIVFDNGTLRDITNDNDNIIDDISNDTAKAVEIISSKFDFLWVNDTYVIFWEDETKYYGLLWSESTNKAISSVKEWYIGMEDRRLEANWYEIGALSGI